MGPRRAAWQIGLPYGDTLFTRLVNMDPNLRNSRQTFVMFPSTGCVVCVQKLGFPTVSEICRSGGMTICGSRWEGCAGARARLPVLSGGVRGPCVRDGCRGCWRQKRRQGAAGQALFCLDGRSPAVSAGSTGRETGILRFGQIFISLHRYIDIAQWTGLTSFQTPAAAVFRRPCTFASLLLIKPDSR